MPFVVYIVGLVLSLIAMACLDARGCKAIDLKPRREHGDREEATAIALIACAVWPLTVSVLAVALFYFLLVGILSRPIRRWACPVVDTRSYGDVKCYKQAYGKKPPECPTHKTPMVDVTDVEES